VGDSFSESSSQGTPDPARNAFAYVPANSTATHKLTNFAVDADVTNGTQYVYSQWFKAGEITGVDWVRPRLAGTGVATTFQFFDLTSGGALGSGSGSVDDAGIIDYGDDWYLCWFSVTANADGKCNVEISPAEADNDAQTTGDGSTVALYVYGGQFEEGGYPSSYIPTDATSETRAADGSLDFTLSSAISGPFTMSHGDYWRPADGSTASFMLELSDGTSNNSADTRHVNLSSAGTARRILTVDGTYVGWGNNGGFSTTDGFAYDTWYEWTIASQSGDHAAYVDGAEVQTGATDTEEITGADQVKIGQVGGLPVIVGRCRIYDSRLTGSQIGDL